MATERPWLRRGAEMYVLNEDATHFWTVHVTSITGDAVNAVMGGASRLRFEKENLRRIPIPAETRGYFGRRSTPAWTLVAPDDPRLQPLRDKNERRTTRTRIEPLLDQWAHTGDPTALAEAINALHAHQEQTR
jgi:hypothetical protein